MELATLKILTFFKRWLSIRLEVIGGLITFFACLFAIIDKDNSDSSLVGLSISAALNVIYCVYSKLIYLGDVKISYSS